MVFVFVLPVAIIKCDIKKVNVSFPIPPFCMHMEVLRGKVQYSAGLIPYLSGSPGSSVG